MRLINDRTRVVVASRVELVTTRQARRRGLLGRETLDIEEGMFLTPCVAVHTAFMRFPIDVAFVDADGRAVQLVHALQPWRLAATLRGRAVIELAAGRLAACRVAVGDRLYLAPGKC